MMRHERYPLSQPFQVSFPRPCVEALENARTRGDTTVSEDESGERAKKLENIDKLRKQLRSRLPQLTEQLKTGELGATMRDGQLQRKLAGQISDTVDALSELEESEAELIGQLADAARRRGGANPPGGGGAPGGR